MKVPVFLILVFAVQLGSFVKMALFLIGLTRSTIFLTMEHLRKTNGLYLLEVDGMRLEMHYIIE